VSKGSLEPILVETMDGIQRKERSRTDLSLELGTRSPSRNHRACSGPPLKRFAQMGLSWGGGRSEVKEEGRAKPGPGDMSAALYPSSDSPQKQPKKRPRHAKAQRGQ